VTFRQLALSNIRGHALRYSAFFLSSTFSVMLFFMYAQFVFHPDVISGYIYGGENSRTVLATCLVLIGVFAFFFVLYSSGAFLRSRNQEFGLLTLLGTTRVQLRRLVWAENTFISVAAITVGVLFGLLFSRLFLLGISRVLDVTEPIRFALVPQALLLTVAGFILLFQVVTLVSSISIGRRQIIDLLREARKPRSAPRAKPLLAGVGALLIIGGYWWALTSNQAMVVVAFLPVTTAVVVGTFLLIGQGSIMILNWLKRHQRTYLSGTRLITISQLVFRMRDNSRLLATIASLSAVVLAGAGTFYSFSSVLNTQSAEMMPQQFALLEPSDGTPVALTADDAEAIIRAHPDVNPTLALRNMVLELEFEDGWATAMPASAISELQAAGLRVETAGETIIIGGTEMQALEPTGISRPGRLSGSWYEVSDADWPTLVASTGALATVLHYDWEDTRASRELATALNQASNPEISSFLINNRHTELSEIRSILGLSLFAGLFISLLFFIGSASLIYFKLFTELTDDRATYRRLGRIGMTWAETARTVTTQIGLVFLLPFALGAVHAVVALDSLGTLLMADVTMYSLAVVGLFAAVQLTFFLLTRWTYLRALRPTA